MPNWGDSATEASDSGSDSGPPPLVEKSASPMYSGEKSFVDLDESLQLQLQLEEDEKAARSMSAEEGGVTTADGEDMVAEALQKEELLLASIPVLDEWHGDRVGNHGDVFSPVLAAKPAVFNVETPGLEPGTTPLVAAASSGSRSQMLVAAGALPPPFAAATGGGSGDGGSHRANPPSSSLARGSSVPPAAAATAAASVGSTEESDEYDASSPVPAAKPTPSPESAPAPARDVLDNEPELIAAAEAAARADGGGDARSRARSTSPHFGAPSPTPSTGGGGAATAAQSKLSMRTTSGSDNPSIVCARQGVMHMQKGEMSAARKCFERSLALNQGSRSLQLKLRTQLSIICRGERSYNEAKVHAAAQLELVRTMRGVNKATLIEEYDAIRAVGVAALTSGLALGRDEDTDDPEKVAEEMKVALLHFEELAKLAETHNNSLVTARAWRDVMKVHRALRNDLQSLNAAEKHLELIRGRGERVEIGRAVSACASLRAKCGEAGDTYWDKREFDGVLELLWEQAAIGQETGDTVLVGQAYYSISKLMENAGSWADWYGVAKARQFLKRAIDSYEASPVKLSKRLQAELADAKTRLEDLNDPDNNCTVM